RSRRRQARRLRRLRLRKLLQKKQQQSPQQRRLRLKRRQLRRNRSYWKDGKGPVIVPGLFLCLRLEPKAVVVCGHRDGSAVGQFAEEDIVRKRLFDLFMDESRHRPSTVSRIEAVGGQPFAGTVVKLNVHSLFGKLSVQL